MSKGMRLYRTMSALICAVCIFFFSTMQTMAAGLAAPTATATQQNVLQVLATYDPDGYYIATESGENMMIWFFGGSIISGIDTAIHETYHGYTHRKYFAGQDIYTGGDSHHVIDYYSMYTSGLLFNTSEMSQNIPKSLRTFRYDGYVAPGASPDANTKGPMGLINEWAAYYTGFRTMDALVPYMLENPGSMEVWREYAISVGNNMTASVEFKYWILGYMNYAQTHHPETFNAILANTEFCKAYADLDARYTQLIAKTQNGLPALNKALASRGLTIEIGKGGAWCRKSGRRKGLGMNDYYTLAAELAKPEYIQMDAVIKQAGGYVPTIQQPGGETRVMTTTQACSIWNEPSTKEANRVKMVPAGYKITVYPVEIPSTNNDGKIFYRTVKGSYVLVRVLQ